MVAKAVVTSIIDTDKVAIEVRRQTACSGECDKCSGCGTPTEFVHAVAMNPVNANVGDTVTVEGANQVIMKYAAIVYALPLVLFFLGYGICAGLALPAWASALTGIAAFFVGIGHAVWRNKHVNQQAELVFTIIRIG